MNSNKTLFVQSIFIASIVLIIIIGKNNLPIARGESNSTFPSIQRSIKNTNVLADPKINVSRIDPEYSADFSNDKILVGASQNIFVGKVVQEKSTKELGFGPETQFEVQVFSNIKGNLSGNVVVDQQGGYENGVLYVVGDNDESGDAVSPSSSANSHLLQPGSTYLFATRYNQQQNWYTLNSYPTASKLLSSNSTLSLGDLQALALTDPRVKQLQAAYPNEVLLSADLAHGNTMNSYQSLYTSVGATSTQNISQLATTSITTESKVSD